jgi:uncharacterized membrane protein YfcA
MTMLLNKFMPVTPTVYIGAATAILSTVFYYAACKPRVIHFVLLSSAVILVIFSAIAFFVGVQGEWPRQLLPLTLEVSILLPLLYLFLNKRRYPIIPHMWETAAELKEQASGTTLMICSLRVFSGLIAAHLALITVGLIFIRTTDNGFIQFMLHTVPIFVCITGMIAGQAVVQTLQHVKDPEIVPSITPEGEILGRVEKRMIRQFKNKHLHPVVRIAVICHDMLLLARRSPQQVIDIGKIDIAIETYMLLGEDVETSAERILKEVFPQGWESLELKFNVKYLFENEETNRLVLLFILDLGTEDGIIYNSRLEGRKLWTFRQIESNLEQGYFSDLFENEYDHLKEVIETREKYREA